MYNLLLSSLLVSSLCLIVYIVAKVLHTILWKPKWLERRLKQQGIKGTTYKNLLIGDMKEFIKHIIEARSKPLNLNHQIVSRVDPFTLNIVEKYGSVSMFWAGKTPRVIIKDIELMKEVLSNKLGHFQKPPLNPQILILTRGLTTQEGEKWIKHRRIIAHAFRFEKLKKMIPVVFSVSCSKMIEQWSNINGVQEGCEVDIWPQLQKLTADVISRAAFGSNHKEGKKIFELQNELIQLVLESMQTLYFPGFRFVPTKKNRRRKDLDNEIKSLIRSLIERKRNVMETGESRNEDLLGLLLECNKQNNLHGEDGEGMDMEDIIEECKQFYLAGQETTSSLLTWTMVVLAIHPEWQAKAREEVLRVCYNEELDFEAVNNLKIVNMILHEVLRLYPPVIALYLHAYKETQIGEISIPAGVDVTLPILLLHHDPELWGDDADEFKPERFSEGVLNAFFPFGWGPRTCIGQIFSMLEAKVGLAMILRNFSFVISPSYTHAPYTVMTLQPQFGAQLLLHKL